MREGVSWSGFAWETTNTEQRQWRASNESASEQIILLNGVRFICAAQFVLQGQPTAEYPPCPPFCCRLF